MFYEKASAEVMLSHKKKAYLDAGFAIKECEHKIRSGEEALKLKGVGKSSASLIDEAVEEKVAKTFMPVGVLLSLLLVVWDAHTQKYGLLNQLYFW